MDRPQLADFLRRSRGRLTPADVGLPGQVVQVVAFVVAQP